MILKQIRFDEQDLQAAETVRRMYGCDSFSQAVRLATRIVASRRRAQFPIPPSPKSSNVRRELKSAEGLIQLPPGVDLDALDALLYDVQQSYRFSCRKPTKQVAGQRRRRAGVSRKASA